MSRLIDRLKQVANAAPQPIGFRTAQTTALKPQMLLIASLTYEKSTGLLAECATGADAVLLPATKSTSGAKTPQKLTSPLPNIPWGKWIEDTDEPEIATLVKGGCDFLVFPASSKVVPIPDAAKLGKILQVAPSLNEGQLRAVSQLPIDAVLTIVEEDREHFLSWQQLLSLQRLTSLSTKPILVSVPPGTTTAELKALWEAGVDGVVIELNSKQPRGEMQQLRQAIADFACRSPHRRGKAQALLPYTGEKSEEATHIETDEEDEDE